MKSKFLFFLLFTLWFLETGFTFQEGGVEISIPTALLVILGLTYFTISFFSIPFGLAITAFSMIFSPEISVGSLGSREIVLRIEDLLIPVLLFAWFAHTAVHRPKSWFAPSPLNRPTLLLVLLSIFSTVNGIFIGWVRPLPALFYGGKLIEFFAIFYLTVNNIRTERQIKYFFFFALLTVVLLGLYTLPQVPGTRPLSPHRITAPFEGTPEPSTAGGYLAFFLVIVVSLFLYESHPVRRWILAGLGILLFIPFLFTFSRTSYFAFLGGMFLLAFLAKKKWLNYTLLLLLLLSPVLLPRHVKERIAFTWEDSKYEGRTMGVDFSLQERIYSLKKLTGVFRASPFYGMGITSSHYIDNQYARTIQEIGLLGLALWVWIFTRLFKIGRWLHQNLEPGLFKGLALGYAAGVICIAIHCFGSITLYVIRIMEPFWFVSGLVVSLYLIKAREYAALSPS